MKEETEDVIVAGESPSLINEESSGPLRSRTLKSRPLKSRELRSRPALESEKLYTDQGAEDLPLEKVNGFFFKHLNLKVLFAIKMFSQKVQNFIHVCSVAWFLLRSSLEETNVASAIVVYSQPFKFYHISASLRR
jgi:hypothetical protein